MENEHGRKSSASFTIEIDQRIIKGFLVDQEATIRELAEAGFPRGAVLDRAGKLGFTPDFLRRHHLDPVDVSVRLCLNCDVPFVSMGSQNRLCNRCRKRQ